MRRHRRNTVGMGLLSLALLTCLTGCLPSAQTSPSAQPSQTASQGEPQLANHAVRPCDNRTFSLPGLSWNTSTDGKGFYVPQSRFLNYYDPEVGTQVPMCSQSGCYHNGENCEAYLAEQVTGFADYNGTWYVLSSADSSAVMWRVEPETGQRTQLCAFTGEKFGESYYFSSGFISHGYAYLERYHDIVKADGTAVTDTTTLRVQLDTGTVEPLFENQNIQVVGAGEQRVLLLVPISVEQPMDMEEYLAQNPGGDYSAYITDFYADKNAADDVMELREYTADLSSYQVVARGYIRANMTPHQAHWGDWTLYAVEENLYLYDLSTGEQRQVDYQGTLTNFFFTDGRIFIFTRDPGLKVYWADVEGGPTQPLKDEGDRKSVTFSTHGESKDYIYGIYSGEEDSVKCILPKEDYWAQRFDHIIPVS